MNRILLTAVTFWMCTDAFAQVREFPYKAKVVVDEAYVRSGAGDAFYPTLLLKKNSIVSVRRHDPGGWYMIDPPEGSFSWIPDRHVRRLNADSGEVLESNVVVFVGSSFGDETHVWQRRLLAGEKVQILDQKTVDSLSGPRSMYKIKPPNREYRWIPGTAVIPVGEQQRSEHDRDPYSVPSNVVRRTPQDPPSDPAPAARADTPAATGPLKYSPSRQLVRLKQIRAEQRRLAEIDRKFRDMILSAPANWDLEKIEQDYRKLQEEATHKPLEGQIDLRYPAIRRYRERKAKLDELNRLTSETDRRDAELLASQLNAVSPGLASGPQNTVPFGSTEWVVDGNAPGEPQPSFDFSSGTEVSAGAVFPPAAFDLTVPAETEFEGTIASVSQSSSPELQTGTPDLKIPPRSRYVGAGFVTLDSSGDGDAFVLTSPNGRVLAHLVSDSVDLKQQLGQSVGLHGKRYFDPKLNRDRIEVSGVEPVRLK